MNLQKHRLGWQLPENVCPFSLITDGAPSDKQKGCSASSRLLGQGRQKKKAKNFREASRSHVTLQTLKLCGVVKKMRRNCEVALRPRRGTRTPRDRFHCTAPCGFPLLQASTHAEATLTNLDRWQKGRAGGLRGRKGEGWCLIHPPKLCTRKNDHKVENESKGIPRHALGVPRELARFAAGVAADELAIREYPNCLASRSPASRSARTPCRSHREECKSPPRRVPPHAVQ